MKPCTGFLAKQLLVLLLCTCNAFAQSTPAMDTQPVYSQAELDQMLAPIALYPDALLSQILMASTYPIEVVLAARWSQTHRNLTGDQAVRAVEAEDWDPSVKSLVAFPRVLDMMDQKLDWTQRLGNAFLSQQQQVMDTVQQLRQKALAAGNLRSDQYVQVVPQEQVIVIEPVNPQVIYVPYYNPTVVYGPWWWPAFPPVFWGPWPGYYAESGVSVGFWWGSGITVGVGFFFGAFDWPHHHVTVVEVHNFYYRPRPPAPNASPGTWWHDPAHRRGVPYRGPVVRERFGQHDARADQRREYRGVEPSRSPALPRPDIPRDERAAREVPRERVRPDGDAHIKPSAPDNSRPEVRTVPARPGVGTTPSRPAAPDIRRDEGIRPEVQRERERTVPQTQREHERERVRPDGGAHIRPSAPNDGRPEPRTAPTRPNTRVTPVRPRGEPQPNIFEGIGRGGAVRDFSARGRASSEAPVQPQRAVPAPRPGGGVSPQRRPSDGGRRDSRDARSQQR